jgi:hypothetical protein
VWHAASLRFVYLQAFCGYWSPKLRRTRPAGTARTTPGAELDLDVAALGDLERGRERGRVLGEVLGHLGRGLEVELVGVEAPVLRILERVAGLDAEQRLVRARVRVVEVVDVAGRDEREPRSLREPGEERVEPLLGFQARVLDLDVRVGRREDLDEPVEVGRRVGLAGLLEATSRSSREPLPPER